MLAALLAAQAGEARGTAQFPGLRVLSARDADLKEAKTLLDKLTEPAIAAEG